LTSKVVADLAGQKLPKHDWFVSLDHTGHILPFTLKTKGSSQRLDMSVEIGFGEEGDPGSLLAIVNV
jgi:hypothetical protein